MCEMVSPHTDSVLSFEPVLDPDMDFFVGLVALTPKYRCSENVQSDFCHGPSVFSGHPVSQRELRPVEYTLSMVFGQFFFDPPGGDTLLGGDFLGKGAQPCAPTG